MRKIVMLIGMLLFSSYVFSASGDLKDCVNHYNNYIICDNAELGAGLTERGWTQGNAGLEYTTDDKANGSKSIKLTGGDTYAFYYWTFATNTNMTNATVTYRMKANASDTCQYQTMMFRNQDGGAPVGVTEWDTDDSAANWRYILDNGAEQTDGSLDAGKWVEHRI